MNHKPYVGQTKQTIERRFMQHAKADSPLGNAMRDCDLENCTIEVIEEYATIAIAQTAAKVVFISRELTLSGLTRNSANG